MTSSNSTLELTISDIEQTVQNGLEALRNAPLNEQITAALRFLTPPGYRPIAQLEEDGRKKRSTAAASNWNPQTGEIVIYFERSESDLARGDVQTPVTDPKPGVTSSGFADDSWINAAIGSVATQEVTPVQIEQCCEALSEAEKAGKAFIALKWFRDTDLMARGYAWTASLATRQAVLTKAIDSGAVLTAQIPNPKAPQHPTTTIKLNRDSEYALSVAPRFQPIRARGGESASEILLRDRGRF